MPFSVNLDPHLEQVLNNYCRERQTSKSAVVRLALAEFLAHVPQAGGNLFLDHPFIGGEPGEDPEAARQSKQHLRDMMAKQAATDGQE